MQSDYQFNLIVYVLLREKSNFLNKIIWQERKNVCLNLRARSSS